MKYKDTERVHAFHQLIYKTLKRPEYHVPGVKVKRRPNDTTIVANDNGKYYKAYLKALNKWESTRLSKVEKLYKRDRNFRKEFNALYALAKNDEVEVDDEFEQYVETFVSPKEALWLKRNRIAMRWCGLGSGPIIHAIAIAQLAAETTEWEIFLRAHLDIMNHRFERSVNSKEYYEKYGDPKPHIMELEKLNVDVAGLILGTCLRVSSVSVNHYFGNAYNLGGSLVAAEDLTAIKYQLLDAVRDTTLDDYNRLVMFNVLCNYIGFLRNSEGKEREWEELKVAMQSMPEHIRPVSIGSD